MVVGNIYIHIHAEFASFNAASVEGLIHSWNAYIELNGSCGEFYFWLIEEKETEKSDQKNELNEFPAHSVLCSLFSLDRNLQIPFFDAGTRNGRLKIILLFECEWSVIRLRVSGIPFGSLFWRRSTPLWTVHRNVFLKFGTTEMWWETEIVRVEHRCLTN